MVTTKAPLLHMGRKTRLRFRLWKRCVTPLLDDHFSACLVAKKTTHQVGGHRSGLLGRCLGAVAYNRPRGLEAGGVLLSLPSFVLDGLPLPSFALDDDTLPSLAPESLRDS